MKFITLFLVLITLFVAGCGQDEVIPPMPSPSPTASPSPGPVPTPSPSPSPSPTPTPDPPLDVDALYKASDEVRAKVREHVRKFIEDGQIAGVDVVGLLRSSPKLEIRIASLDSWGSSTIGLCQTSRSYRIVTFDPDYFGRYGDVQDRILSHHELGHCVLYRGHRTDIGVIPDGSNHRHELSVMYPMIFGKAQYTTHEPFYIDELFTETSSDGPVKTFICGE